MQNLRKCTLQCLSAFTNEMKFSFRLFCIGCFFFFNGETSKRRRTCHFLNEKQKKSKSIKRFSWRQLASSSSCRRRLRWCRRRPECDVCRSRSHRCRRARERRTLIVSDFASCRRIGYELKETIVVVETWIIIRKLYIWLLVKKICGQVKSSWIL